jgi:ABC toxin N-terminal region/Neuraminidase-like domain
MAVTKKEPTIRIRVLNAQGQPLGGTVDIEFKPEVSGKTVNIKRADASQDIDVPGLQRSAQGVYQAIVTPPGVLPVAKFVNIPATGFETVDFVFAQEATATASEAVIVSKKYEVQGSLTFDNGLVASGIVTRIYTVGFGGKDTRLGETTSDAQGNYSISYALPRGLQPNIQVRVVGSAQQEVTISATQFNVQPSMTLNLVVPASVQPLAPEFDRLSADMKPSIGGVANLAQAQESSNQQDLTLLNQSTSWDARLVALAATAGQQTSTTGLGQDVLYALFRVGLPTDPSQLATVPAATVTAALTKASQSGIVTMNDQQINAATAAFQKFSSTTYLALKTPGAVSSFKDILAVNLANSKQQSAFANLYFSNPQADDFWEQAAQLKIEPQTLDTLKLQGKFLYLTFNNAALAQRMQQVVGSLTNIAQVADKDFDTTATWQNTLNSLAGTGGDQALQNLIPAIYTGATTADRLAAYTGDLARKVRMSFPTQVAARMIERKDLPLSENTATNVTAFLRAAANLGYSLGRTPLNAFISQSGQSLPTLDADSTASLKTVHRLFQITPSTESLQAAMKAGFTSARDIAAFSKDEFVNKYGTVFPPGEAVLVHGRSQVVSSVTFNIFTSAKQLDNVPPVYGVSGSGDARQQAKNSIVQQFPSMASLFGNLDYCQCDDCRSVLSPAAYFVDILEFLNPKPVGANANPAGYTPLDVLLGKDKTVTGRRPDLGALPLTCENTNTAMPYIDIVNEILEYYITHSDTLDTNLAYDTGTATTAELTAEPQNILPQVYDGPLKQAVYPLDLPFDLWIETVRGFLNYFQTSLAQVLDTLRPVDNLELFTDGNAFPYYRAQIFAEALGLSPAEYAVFTGSNPARQPLSAHWFELFGYTSEAIALHGVPDPTDPTQFLTEPLTSAKNLSQVLGVTYQNLTDLVQTGFLNPRLYALLFQLERFGISMSDAFSYTGQPGYPAMADVTVFEASLARITAEYTALNPSSTFDAKVWIKSILPANYSTGVLVLATPSSGCNFGTTSLQYADNATAATPLDFVKLNLFVRLWQKLGWTMDEVDRSLQLFFPATLPAWGDPGFDAAFGAAWKTALVYLAHLDDLNTRLAPTLGRTALLPFWSNLAVQGKNPLYAQLFLTPSVLNNDWAFDDPHGIFPTPLSDFAAAPPYPPLTTFSPHLSAVQGALGLTADEITAIFADAGATVTTVSYTQNAQLVTAPSFTLTNLSICYRYRALAKCLQLSVKDMIALKAMAASTTPPIPAVGLDPFQPLSGNALNVLADDVLFNQTLLFVKQVAVVQNSGFTVADLQYLLRQVFDPVGKYQPDANALTTLAQSVASGLQLIQSQNTVPANLTTMSESLLDQTLSTLIPSTVLKPLFSLLTNTQTYTGQGTFTTAVDPTPFAKETELGFAFDSTTDIETIGFQGYLTAWKKTQLEGINAAISSMLDQVQANAQAALTKSVGDLLGVWASMVQYEAIRTGVAAAIPSTPLVQADPAITLSYDQTDQLQWIGYRGVLTDTKKAALLGVFTSPDFVALLSDLQAQTASTYANLIGSILAMWTNVQTYQFTQTGVATADQIDGSAFAAALALAQQAGTIGTGIPQLQFSYSGGNQTIVCQGVLTAATQTLLAALIPASTVLPTLLTNVRTQAVNLFTTLAANLLTVTAADLDKYAIVGLDPTKQQAQVKAQLISAFLPLLSQKLAQQLVVQTLSANLAADPSLVTTLITDAALLSDPSNPGKSLQGAFLGIGNQGVSATYYDGAGTVLKSGTAATVDTADTVTSMPASTKAAHFEGYLQVPTDGPYRFFAELGDTGATALLHLDAPDPSALLTNPIIPATPATATPSEISQFAQLSGGALYHFTIDFTALGANGAKLLIQGESLSKGPLSEIILYPLQAFTAFTRAQTLLAKVLQILQVTSLDEREINYLVANSAQFNNLRLSSLPTQASDDTPANAISLFSQFLALADYADLRQGPAGGSDSLIDVFQNVGQPFTEAVATTDTNKNAGTPWTRLANLTRRDAATVRAIGEYFGLIQDQVVGTNRQVTAIGDFGNNRGIRRIWQALQLIQIVGIPVASLTASTVIASPAPPASTSFSVIAANFKNSVKAQYTAANWQPIAQSVFNQLRKEKRDALVSYLVSTMQLENSNQLFEYFLVDPGMEPVVQTSRLRLAMSSVQTFIQRCLLNLENANTNPALNVAPTAIDADWWEWMKRYRVWQANREIFLYPENWMEPELRLYKTDLFEQLESSLLQGNVTSDLAEDAFNAYLKGLDVRARLDIVATYLDQDLTDASLSTLHVLGRTYGHPHKYFYRTYTTGIWSGWIAVTPDIDGNHMVLAIWKGRLNIFWVTFISQQQPPRAGGTPPAGAVTGLDLAHLTAGVNQLSPSQQVQVQLHWVEYFQGKWTNRIATDPNSTPTVMVNPGFTPSSVYIHVSKELDSSGNEGAVRIHLDFPPVMGPRSYLFQTVSDTVNVLDRAVLAGASSAGSVVISSQVQIGGGGYAFRLTSKNCAPDFGPQYWQAAPPNPYSASKVDATLYEGSGSLSATFLTDVQNSGAGTPDKEVILGKANNFSVLPVANPVVPSPFLDKTEPLYSQLGSLVSPFFYKDTSNPWATATSFGDELTFFVQPTLTETTIDQWNGWAIGPAAPAHDWSNPALLNNFNVIAQVPVAGPKPVNPGDPATSVYTLRDTTDWVTNSAAAVSYGGSVIGKSGGITFANLSNSTAQKIS